MSAKPKIKDEITGSDDTSASSRSDDLVSQDIFVADDPALSLKKQTIDRSNALPDSKAVPFNNDLKIEKLTYIHQMLGELRKLSVTLDEPMVAYLIEMALLEADTALNVGHFRMDLGSKNVRPV